MRSKVQPQIDIDKISEIVELDSRLYDASIVISNE